MKLDLKKKNQIKLGSHIFNCLLNINPYAQLIQVFAAKSKCKAFSQATQFLPL